jgi:hypothetical protein
MHKSRGFKRASGALALVCMLGAFAARADGSVSALGMGMGAHPGEMPRFDAVVAK